MLYKKKSRAGTLLFAFWNLLRNCFDEITYSVLACGSGSGNENNFLFLNRRDFVYINYINRLININSILMHCLGKLIEI